MSKHTTADQDEYTFYNDYGLHDKTDNENLTIVVYFIFTTLTTVGFGDFNPKSEIERGIMTFILLIGVAAFSYIISQFLTILMDVQTITAENEDSESLAQWMLLLKNFNKNRPLPPQMLKEFEAYFVYFWKNDKNYAVSSAEDQEMLSELPSHIQSDIYRQFLFKDFLEQFRVYFDLERPAIFQDSSGTPKYFDWQDIQYSAFMIRILGSLEPRSFKPGQYIFEAEEEVDEHIYVISRDPRKPLNSTGCYAVGFRYDKDHKFFHVKLGPKTIIGGYENIYGKKAEYFYKALMHVDAYGLRKE